MQSKKINIDYVLLSVPKALMSEAGLSAGSLLQMTAEEGKLMIERVTEVETSDYVCDDDCENCPINALDCDGDCAACPCQKNCEESEV